MDKPLQGFQLSSKRSLSSCYTLESKMKPQGFSLKQITSILKHPTLNTKRGLTSLPWLQL